jgi:hypothetical protein
MKSNNDVWSLTPSGIVVAQAIRAAKQGNATEQQLALLRKHGFSTT